MNVFGFELFGKRLKKLECLSHLKNDKFDVEAIEIIHEWWGEVFPKDRVGQTMTRNDLIPLIGKISHAIRRRAFITSETLK